MFEATGAVIKDATIDNLKIGANAVTVPDGVAQNINKNLTQTYQLMGDLTVDYDSNTHTPSGVIAVAGLQVPGDGSVDRVLTMELRRVYTNNTYSGQHVTNSVQDDRGMAMTLGAHFTVGQVSTSTSFKLELWAKIGNDGGTRSANRFFIHAIASKR